MKALLMIMLLITAGTANALPLDVFDAEQQCQLRTTSQGARYVPPCQFLGTTVYAGKNNNYLQGDLIEGGLFKTILNYTFTCESLRSLSIRFNLSNADGSSVSNRIAGSRIYEPSSVELTHGNNDSVLYLEELSGATGFQAMKPGCKLTVDQLVTYPEPRYFNQIAQQLVSFNTHLELLFSQAIPSTGHTNLLYAINNTIATLEYMQFDIEDDILAEELRYILDDLSSTKTYLESNCGSGSYSHLCTAQIANLRSSLTSALSINEDNIAQLYNFLNSQTTWLASKYIGRDQTILQNAVKKLKTRL